MTFIKGKIIILNITREEL